MESIHHFELAGCACASCGDHIPNVEPGEGLLCPGCDEELWQQALGFGRALVELEARRKGDKAR